MKHENPFNFLTRLDALEAKVFPEDPPNPTQEPVSIFAGAK